MDYEAPFDALQQSPIGKALMECKAKWTVQVAISDDVIKVFRLKC
jgi:hypothetical protein